LNLLTQWGTRVDAALMAMSMQHVVFSTSLQDRHPDNQKYHAHQGAQARVIDVVCMPSGVHDEESLPFYRLRFDDGVELEAGDEEIFGTSSAFFDLLTAVSGAFAVARELDFIGPTHLANEATEETKRLFIERFSTYRVEQNSQNFNTPPEFLLSRAPHDRPSPVHVVVCTHQSDGAPAFYSYQGAHTKAQCSEGQHYDEALRQARDNDYEGTAVAFDLSDPAAGQLARLASLACRHRSGMLAAQILGLDGIDIVPTQPDDFEGEQIWTLTSPTGERLAHKTFHKNDAALNFVPWLYHCTMNDWLHAVVSRTTTLGHAEWTEGVLEAIRDTLVKRKNSEPLVTTPGR
jgi:hypothetical protein